MASKRASRDFDPDDDQVPLPRNTLSTNGQWFFGSLYAGLALIGFSFGVWAGANRPKVEIVEAKKDTDRSTAQATPVVKPPITPTPEPKAKEPEPELMPKEKEKEPEPTPEPKKKEPEPEPKKKEPEPAPKKKEPEPKKVNAKPVAFKELEPIFRSYCNNCHGAAGKPKAGVDLRTAAAILKGGTGGAIVKPGDPENSPLYLSMKPPDATMPPDGKPGPNEKELKLIHDWIAGGAKPRRTVRRRR
ncbi:c-type cytochrome domain-containing protein [Gemmata sp. JC717]|uniref:c-type cytochrome domain-containing protein n=1 Tax=Gemmata algarum TaxID=2975278 RepID=UPI0021BB7A40|nr:c-type cytochrome domain-containing protein [Gemmata algarum]MDY3555364.1 c-type cytochrome domain-containing protein [Gemmata algarum]